MLQYLKFGKNNALMAKRMQTAILAVCESW